jgi:hypothetical protein
VILRAEGSGRVDRGWRRCWPGCSGVGGAVTECASNLPFSEWGQVIPDPRLVAAIVDRLTFNAHIIETGTDSYRLRSTRDRRRNPTA